MIACIVFVFAALVEYTGILLKMKMRKLTGTKRKKDNYAITDLAFFVIFPILFIIFNVLYWSSIVWNRQGHLDKVSLETIYLASGWKNNRNIICDNRRQIHCETRTQL